MKNYFLKPFRHNNKTSRILLFVFFFINFIVFLNAVFHDPAIGYDARQHIRKIPIMAELQYPARRETVQYCDPPLSAVLPAFFYLIGLKIHPNLDLYYAVKFAQFCHLLYSIGLTFYLLKICKVIRSDSLIFRSWLFRV